MSFFSKNFKWLDPGPNGRDTGPSPDIQQWQNADLGNLQFDQSGYPVGFNGPPSADRALQVQYLGNRATEQRRSRFFSDALGALRQGSRVIESYRPGGAAALRSGIYQQQSNLLYNQGLAQTAPDFLSDFRRDAQAKADIQAGRASRIKTVLGVINTAAGIAGIAAGGGAAAAPAALGAEPAAAAPAAGPAQPARPSAIGAPAQLDSGNAAQQGVEAPTPMRGPGGSALAARGGAGPTEGGDPASPGGAPAGGGASPDSRPTSGGAAPSPGGVAMSGGYGQDGQFHEAALAASAVRVDPLVERVVLRSYVQSMDTAFWAAADYNNDRLLEHALATIG